MKQKVYYFEMPNGRYIGKCETTEAAIRSAMPKARIQIKGQVVKVLTSP